MARHGKNFKQAVEKVERRPYSLSEAVGLAKEAAFAKFDETMEVAMRLGVDPRHADQMVRGTVALPHGTGKSVRVSCFVAICRISIVVSAWRRSGNWPAGATWNH